MAITLVIVVVLVGKMKVRNMQDKEKEIQVDQVEILKLQNHLLFHHAFLHPR